MAGYNQGLHRSPYHGFSSEFSEFRPYTQGDDLRFLDWQVYGRHNRPFIRRFEAETNLNALIVVDVSRSMDYHSNPDFPTKYQYAALLASALIRLFNSQNDAAGLALIQDEAVASYSSPANTAAKFKHCLALMENAQVTGGGEIAQPLPGLARRLKGRGQIILISDFLHELEGLENALKYIGAQRNEISLLQVLDPEETEFRSARQGVYEDMETGFRLTVNPEWLKARYLERVRAHQQELEEICKSHRGHFHLISTQEAPFGILGELTARRQRKP